MQRYNPRVYTYSYLRERDLLCKHIWGTVAGSKTNAAVCRKCLAVRRPKEQAGGWEPAGEPEEMKARPAEDHQHTWERVAVACQGGIRETIERCRGCQAERVTREGG
jgi:hypothetical protein